MKNFNYYFFYIKKVKANTVLFILIVDTLFNLHGFYRDGLVENDKVVKLTETFTPLHLQQSTYTPQHHGGN